MIPNSRLRTLLRPASLALLAVTAILTGCAGTGGGGYPVVVAYQPAALSNVKVKVSLKTQNVYVEEGDRLLMVTATTVGRAGYATPTGHFNVFNKDRTKRSNTYGYWVNGSDAHPGPSDKPYKPGYHYVGYPMAYWVEFSPAYGFHEGPIWPVPRSHGCLHLPPSASAKFFQLVQIGTPVDIAQSQPEDATFGRNLARPDDSRAPDPAPQMMVTNQFFDMSRDTVLLPQPVK